MGVPKLCRNPDGRAYATIPKSGRKRVYFGEYGTQEAEKAYRKWLMRVLADIPEESAFDLDDWTITDLCVEWLKHAHTEFGAKDFNAIKNVLKRFERLFGRMPCKDISADTLDQYKAAMAAETWRRHKGPIRNYSRSHINKHLNWIKRLVRWACRKKYLPPQVWTEIQLVEGPKVRKKEGVQSEAVRPVAWQDVVKTLPYMPRTVAEVVQVQWYCGMRPSEALQIRGDGIDASRPSVWLYTPSEHKNTHRGLLLTKAIPRPAQAILKPRMKKYGDSYLFPSPKSEYYNTYSYRTAILRACEKARKRGVEVEDWTPLRLRHGIATDVRARYGIEAAQLYLGHTTPDVTAIYAEKSLTELLALAERLDGEVFRQGTGEELPPEPSQHTST